MGKRVLAALALAIACAALYGFVSPGEAMARERDGNHQALDSDSSDVEEMPATTPTPVPPTVGTGYRDPETTYLRGVAAMSLVLGIAVGGTVVAARLRIRRI